MIYPVTTAPENGLEFLVDCLTYHDDGGALLVDPPQFYFTPFYMRENHPTRSRLDAMAHWQGRYTALHQYGIGPSLAATTTAAPRRHGPWPRQLRLVDAGLTHRAIHLRLGGDERRQPHKRPPPRGRRLRQVPALGHVIGDHGLEEIVGLRERLLAIVALGNPDAEIWEIGDEAALFFGGIEPHRGSH